MIKLYCFQSKEIMPADAWVEGKGKGALIHRNGVRRAIITDESIGAQDKHAKLSVKHAEQSAFN